MTKKKKDNNCNNNNRSNEDLLALKKDVKQLYPKIIFMQKNKDHHHRSIVCEKYTKSNYNNEETKVLFHICDQCSFFRILHPICNHSYND